MRDRTLRAFHEELQKIAAGAGFTATASKAVAAAREAGKVKNIPFMEGMKRNLVATGRRLMNPKDAVRRTKGMFTTPGLPLWQKGLAGVGLVGTAANALPEQDPSGQGKSRTRRALEGIGGTIGGAAGKGLVGSLAAGAVGTMAGNIAGKAVDAVRGYRPPPPQMSY